MPRVTVVNHHPEFLELVRDILEGDRYDTTTIDSDLPGTLDSIRASRPDLLIIDLRLRGNEHHGWDIAKRVRADPELNDLPVIVCSADMWAMQEIASELAETQHVAALAKPFRIDELVATIERLLAERVGG